MKTLVPIDDLGIFVDMQRTILADSRRVAEVFEKQHKHVLRDIERYLDPDSGLHDPLRASFKPMTYKDTYGREQPAYGLTRKGFFLVAMGFTGKKALQFKEAYIERYDAMEQYILNLDTARMEYSKLTEAIQRSHANPQFYHYANEADMLNRIVLGCTAKQFRKKNEIPDGESIRPHLTYRQIAAICSLQQADAVLVKSGMEYAQRKAVLTSAHETDKNSDKPFVSAALQREMQATGRTLDMKPVQALPEGDA